MYPYLIKSGFLTVRWENVMIIIGILAGVWLLQRRTAAKGLAYQNAMLDLSIWLVVAGIGGARLWEMLFTWDEYVQTPWSRLAIWQGGMSIQGSILGGLVAVVLFAWRRKLRVWELLDLLAPPVILGQAIGRIGCLFSGDAFGLPVADVPWWPQWAGLVYHPESPAGLLFGNTPLVPAETLELVMNLAIFWFLVRFRPRREFSGRVVVTYAFLYSLARFGLEFLRADSLLFGGLKVAQLLSLVVVAAVPFLWRYRTGAHRHKEAAG